MGTRLVKINFLSVLFVFFTTHATPDLEYSSQVDSGIKQSIHDEQPQKLSVSHDFGKIPLYFIPNEGQVNEKALYYAKTPRYTLWMTRGGLVFDSSRKLERKTNRQEIKGKPDSWEMQNRDIQPESYERDVSRLVFLNAEEDPEVVPIETTEHRVNYFKGNNKNKWKTDISASKSVLYKNIYKSIDLKVYGVENQIEYDWIIKPGGNPEEIIFNYEGIKDAEIDSKGNLLVQTEFGEFIHKRPVSYQVIDRDRVDVESSFICLEEDTYGFQVKSYDKKNDLIIDPVVLIYSTYLGGSSSWELAYSIAVDGSGSAYITGYTGSTDFPTQNPYQTDQGDWDAFVTKLSPAGNSLVYSTYLGGSDDESPPYTADIAVDGSGSAYIIGYTWSTDFPTQNPYQTYQGNQDAFITKLSPAGNSLVYSTYLGGSGWDGVTHSANIAVDSSGSAYVTGMTYSTDFPTQNPYQTDQGDRDAFVTKLSPAGNSLVYSTYLGGSSSDGGDAIAVDSYGNAYVTGGTLSTDFPSQNPYQTYQGNQDAFITKLSPDGSSLVYSTYLGSSHDEFPRGIAVDSSGSAYVAGGTEGAGFPTQNPYQAYYGGGTHDVFVTKLSPSGNSLVYSTYLGSSSVDWGDAIAVDSYGSAYVTGYTDSSDFPTQNPYQTYQGGGDAFVTKLSPAGNGLSYSTYLGGTNYETAFAISVDSSGSAYVTGMTDSTDFPTQNPYQTDQGDQDAFVTKLVEIDPEISLSKTQICFGADTSGEKTSDQNFSISNSGVGTLEWSISDNANWLSCDPTSGSEYAVINVSVDQTGLTAGTYNATITVASPDAHNSPQEISVVLVVYNVDTDSAPFGIFDTPVDGTTVSGSVPITGWALDDIEVIKIDVKRDPDPDDPPEAIGSDGLVLISWPPEGKNNVVFVKGSRTDVEALYPDYPLNDRAGWGYMLLTYGLPRQGNGVFRLYAFAEDNTGHRVLLGTKQITSDNANRVKPFGTIDTPNQGEVISDNYVNFGWTLTPPPKMIPTDGSTIWISMDGIYIAHPDYNHFRQDIHDNFPAYLNCDGAVGFYWIDTTSYANGVHNIGWYAVDDNGDADGFGSRFFEIQNVGGIPAPSSGSDALRYRVDTSGRLRISVEGQHWIEAEQLERVKIVLKGEGGNRFIGWGADENKGLPIGSTLDKEDGVFYWSIGPGFLNSHILHFAVTGGAFRSEPVQVIVNIVPKRFDRFTKKEIIKDRKK